MITLRDYLWCAAEQSSSQAREKEEQRSPFWGSRTVLRLYHSLPARRLTPSFLFAVPPAEDAASVRTLFLLFWRFGQAPPYPSQRVWPTLLLLAWRPQLRFLVPSLAPAITQRPLVAPGGRTLRMLAHLYSLKLLKTLPPDLRAILPLLHGFGRV
ncbi:hypothetical protein XENOCAPTIV_002747 [Xenoophorus captivus]|uniref:Uncharacterized protein n=1 Tax=Xenoophorus captivus TaxID=1517983 RepID=A0ABV0SDW1_9TELE